MAISLVNATVGGGDSVASVTMTKPSGVTSGDLLVVFQSWSYDKPSPATVLSGWTQWDEQVSQGTDATSPKVRLSYKFAGGSEPASYAITTSGTGNNALVMGAFRGVDTTTPLALTMSWATTANSPTQTLPGRTIPENNVFWIGLWSLQRFASPPTDTWTKPAEMTLVAQRVEIFNNVLMAFEARSTGATGDRIATITNSGSAGRVGSIGLKMATTAPTYTKAGSSGPRAAGSGTKVVSQPPTYVKSGGGGLRIAGSGVKITTAAPSYVKTGSSAVRAAGSGSRSLSYPKVGSGGTQVAGSGSKVVTDPPVFVKAGSGAIGVAGSGSKTLQAPTVHAKAGSGGLGAAGSGSSTVVSPLSYVKSGSGALGLAGSGLKSTTAAPIYAKTGSGGIEIAGSGSKTYGDENTISKAGGSAISIGGSGFKTVTPPPTYAKSGLGAIGLAGSGASLVGIVYTKSGGGALRLAGSGTKTLAAPPVYEKRAGGGVQLAGSGRKVVRVPGVEPIEVIAGRPYVAHRVVGTSAEQAESLTAGKATVRRGVVGGQIRVE